MPEKSQERKFNIPEAEREFYEESKLPEGKPFRPGYPDDELATEVSRNALKRDKPAEAPAADVHHEAGMPLKTQYASEREMLDAVQNLIDTKKAVTATGAANKLQEQANELWEQYNKPAQL